MKQQNLFYREKKAISVFLAFALTLICVLGGRQTVWAEESMRSTVNEVYSDDVTFPEAIEPTEPAVTYVPVTTVNTTTTTRAMTTTYITTEKYIVSSEEVCATVAPSESVKTVTIVSVANQNYSCDDTEFNTDDIILDVTYEYYHPGTPVYVYYFWSDGSTTVYQKTIGMPTSYDFNRQYTLSKLNPKFEYSSPAEAYKALCQNINVDINTELEFSCKIVEPFYGGSNNYYTFTGTIPIHISAPKIVTTTSPPTTTQPVITIIYNPPVTTPIWQEHSFLSINAPDSSQCYVGNTFRINFSAVCPPSSYEDMSWSSSDKNVAVIDSDGYVTITGAGTVTISGSNGYASHSVTFNTYYLATTDISVTQPITTTVYNPPITTSQITTSICIILTAPPTTTQPVITTIYNPPATTPNPITTPDVPAETESLNIVINNLTVIIISCDEAAVNVVVPSMIDGIAVTEIGRYAFYNCSDLQMIKIENPDCEIYDDSSTINENAVICGYWNSTAHDYALKYNREFYSINGIPVTLKGDISGNGSIDLYDAIEIAEHIMGMRTFTDEEKEIADYNGDGRVDLYDAIGIAKKLIEK